MISPDITRHEAERMELGEIVRNLREITDDAPSDGHLPPADQRSMLNLLYAGMSTLDDHESALSEDMKSELRYWDSGYYDGPITVDLYADNGMYIEWEHPDSEDPITLTDLEEMGVQELIDLREDLLHRTQWSPATSAVLAFITSELAVRAVIYQFDDASSVR